MLLLVSLTDDHLSIRKTKINISEDKSYRETGRGISLYMGWSFLLQAKHGLVLVASQWQSAGGSRGLAVSKARGLDLTLPYYQAAPPKLVLGIGQTLF